MKGGKRIGAGRPVGAKDNVKRRPRAAPRKLVAVSDELAQDAAEHAKRQGLTLREWIDRAIRMQSAWEDGRPCLREISPREVSGEDMFEDVLIF